MQAHHEEAHDAAVLCGLLHQIQKNVRDACGAQRGAEHGGSHQKADRAHHARKAAAVEHLIHKRRIRMDYEAAVHRVHKSLEIHAL